ncbi:hypothetical protein RvY_16129 [Ramazzottius varieornatus]|uniref:SEA domain-containing protein n=1 Tax=Ramazzottius varieornatus TaxID=947166 RepID=A0A1D1VXD7_RAMVA|nr:hypothetical protein RvY_16129 [Ramazzottius varieornatus]
MGRLSLLVALAAALQVFGGCVSAQDTIPFTITDSVYLVYTTAGQRDVFLQQVLVIWRNALDQYQATNVAISFVSERRAGTSGPTSTGTSRMEVAYKVTGSSAQQIDINQARSEFRSVLKESGLSGVEAVDGGSDFSQGSGSGGNSGNQGQSQGNSGSGSTNRQSSGQSFTITDTVTLTYTTTTQRTTFLNQILQMWRNVLSSYQVTDLKITFVSEGQAAGFSSSSTKTVTYRVTGSSQGAINQQQAKQQLHQAIRDAHLSGVQVQEMSSSSFDSSSSDHSDSSDNSQDNHSGSNFGSNQSGFDQGSNQGQGSSSSASRGKNQNQGKGTNNLNFGQSSGQLNLITDNQQSNDNDDSSNSNSVTGSNSGSSTSNQQSGSGSGSQQITDTVLMTYTTTQQRNDLLNQILKLWKTSLRGATNVQITFVSVRNVGNQKEVTYKITWVGAQTVNINTVKNNVHQSITSGSINSVSASSSWSSQSFSSNSQQTTNLNSNSNTNSGMTNSGMTNSDNDSDNSNFNNQNNGQFGSQSGMQSGSQSGMQSGSRLNSNTNSNLNSNSQNIQGKTNFNTNNNNNDQSDTGMDTSNNGDQDSSSDSSSDNSQNSNSGFSSFNQQAGSSTSNQQSGSGAGSQQITDNVLMTYTTTQQRNDLLQQILKQWRSSLRGANNVQITFVSARTVGNQKEVTYRIMWSGAPTVNLNTVKNNVHQFITTIKGLTAPSSWSSQTSTTSNQQSSSFNQQSSSSNFGDSSDTDSSANFNSNTGNLGGRNAQINTNLNNNAGDTTMNSNSNFNSNSDSGHSSDSSDNSNDSSSSSSTTFHSNNNQSGGQSGNLQSSGDNTYTDSYYVSEGASNDKEQRKNYIRSLWAMLLGVDVNQVNVQIRDAPNSGMQNGQTAVQYTVTLTKTAKPKGTFSNMRSTYYSYLPTSMLQGRCTCVL